jgi:hypothetical protein
VQLSLETDLQNQKRLSLLDVSVHSLGVATASAQTHEETHKEKSEGLFSFLSVAWCW